MKQQNDYLIRVKANQKKLYHGIGEIVTQQTPCTHWIEEERTRDRQTERRVWAYNQIEGLDPRWEGLNQVVLVERRGWRGATPYLDRGYYITSLKDSAQRLGEQIRRHWEIENRLHWVKDVVFGEDTTPITQNQVPEKLSVLRQFVINIFRKNKMDSISRAIRKVAHDLDAICKLIE